MRRGSFVILAVLMLVPCLAWAQGNPLGPEFRVNTTTASDQQGASISASASSFGFVVVWTSLSQDGSGYGVFGQRYATSGTPLGPEFRVNTFTTSNQYHPVVAVDSAGDFVVVWNSNAAASYGLFGQRYASTGVPLGPEFRVNTYTSGFACYPSVGADLSGNFVVAWMSYGQEGGPDWGIFAQRFASTGVPLGPEFHVNTFTVGYQGRAVVTASTGNFVVLWNSNGQDGSSLGVFGQRYAAAGPPLGPEFRVNTYVLDAQYGPSVAIDTAGNFVAVWRSFGQDGSSNGVFGQRFASSGAPSGPEFRVNTFTTGYQAYPSVAADANGNFVVAWNSFDQDGSGFGIFGQRYAAAGTPLGPEFRVNTFTTGYQTYPGVASDGLGNFVVAWQSNLQDGSAFGVFGQRYAAIVPVELMHFQVE